MVSMCVSYICIFTRCVACMVGCVSERLMCRCSVIGVWVGGLYVVVCMGFWVSAGKVG